LKLGNRESKVVLRWREAEEEEEEEETKISREHEK